MKLNRQIMAILLVITVVPLLVYGYFSSSTLRENIIQEKKESLRREVDLAISILTSQYNLFQSGNISESQSKDQSMQLIRTFRHGEQLLDYFWIHTLSSPGSQIIMLMHPFTLTLEGTDISGFSDPNGIYLFKEMNQVISKSTDQSGFVEYSWQYYSEKDNIMPKLSYVKAFPQWNWVVGTGFYLIDINNRISDQSFSLIVGILLIAIILLGVSYFLSSLLAHPLVNLTNMNKSIANGDLTTKYKGNTPNDELKRLVTSYEEMTGFITPVIQNTREIIEQLTQTSQALATSSEEVNASSEEISSIAQFLNNGALKQNEAIEISKSEIELFRSKFNVVSENINQKVRQIENILRQINILSLNASIESARAGEYGRGFAVVAGNIRNLADNTNDILKSIIDATNDLRNVITESLETLKQSILKVSNISMKNLANSEETTAATEEQSATMEEISSSAQELSNVAILLQESIKKFKI